MSVSFGGVLVSREAGSFMPTNLFTKAVVTDCTINTLKLDSGAKSYYKDEFGTTVVTNITSDPANLPLVPNTAWSLNTVLFANFNGDLEAGPLSFYGAEVDSIMVRRSSNRTNFIIWDDIRLIKDIKNVVNEDKEFTFKDKAIESGLWYTYAIQPISQDTRGSLYKGARRALVYEDAFLVGENGKQLKLKYNAAISSVKRNIKESRIETIGSKYPFVTRNASTDYKEFSLSGTITHFMDETEEFAPRADLFVDDEFKSQLPYDMTIHYDSLYRENNLNNYNNTVLEREFRNRVEEFLLDGKPKLFKSPTEGNSIVRIMDVTMTPNQQLGRLIYDFSCNIIEVDSFNVFNLNKYNIQESGR